MEQEKKQAVALMRYSAIAPLLQAPRKTMNPECLLSCRFS